MRFGRNRTLQIFRIIIASAAISCKSENPGKIQAVLPAETDYTSKPAASQITEYKKPAEPALRRFFGYAAG